MATVPIQQTPTVGIETGGTPLFSGTNVAPVQDTTTDDIQRLGLAQKQFAQIALQLQDEQDDVKANEATTEYNDYANQQLNSFLQLRGGDAIKTLRVEDGREYLVTDELRSNLNNKGQEILDRLGNSNQKQIFTEKFDALRRIAINKATKHSITERRKQLDADTKAAIELAQSNAIATFENALEPDGEHAKFFGTGLVEIKRKHDLKGNNTDPTQGLLSNQYLLDVQNYKLAVTQGVYKNLEEAEEHKLAEEYLKAQKPPELKNVQTKQEKQLEKSHKEFNAKQISSAILMNNNNQNDGNYLSVVNKLLTLKSNHYVDDGTGASVKDGLHSNEFNIVGQTRENNINTLELERNKSKFYRLDSNLTLIEQHQPIHLQALLHLGFKKADSLYTKAKREYEASILIPKKIIRQRATTGNREKYKKEFLDNPDNFETINTDIANRYVDLIVKEARRKYSKFSNKQGNLGSFDFKQIEKTNNYINQIANDLQILVKDTDYNFNQMAESQIKVDKITGLQPKNILKQKVKETITEPEDQQIALNDLDIKYEKIKNERETNYNNIFTNAKLIAFEEPNGYENLAQNNIDINLFTEEDQKILKQKLPEESDVNTVVELIDNPAELRDNIDSHIHKLTRPQYAELKRYSESLKGENNYVEATGNVTMLKATLDRYDMGDLHRGKNKEDKRKYLAIHDAWLKEINARQIANKNQKLTMGQKQEALDHVLLTDLVNVDVGGLFGRDRTNVISSTVEFDNLENIYVDVLFEGQNVKVFPSKINDEVVKAIQKNLRKYDQPVTQHNVARDWLSVGKPANLNELYGRKEN
tara:strand:- start:49 stop:2496 length:2448 start_codon:yes stop_codon:yes gene_type:complete